jgi:hypothetical protein
MPEAWAASIAVQAWSAIDGQILRSAQAHGIEQPRDWAERLLALRQEGLISSKTFNMVLEANEIASPIIAGSTSASVQAAMTLRETSTAVIERIAIESGTLK